ncbi:MAG: helix-turn-helix transcriptional regulator [Oscillospiraceae bacterium]|nr:helix-turn-helix transcriptional regulator [Oscillospiraceae bacterium]
MDAKATGQLIAARRRALDLSQAELAERLHVTDKAVSRWETGRGMPAIDSLEPLAEALGLSVSELLSGRELTAEELPREAGSQIVETLRQNAGMARRGVLATLLILAVLAASWTGYHYFTSVGETDGPGLARKAAEYLGRPRRSFTPEFDYEHLQIAELERRGDYLAALCTDGKGGWAMCVYDQDRLFKDRWRGGGGKPRLESGTLGSWNFGNPREAVIILCGGELPEDAAYYTFQNSGITYTCPIEDGQVLDIFLLPDTADIGAHSLTLLDQDQQPLDSRPEGAAHWAA